MDLSAQRIGTGGAVEIEAQVLGLDAAWAAVRELFADVAEHAMGGALYREALDIMAEAKTEVPVDTGVLRASGFVAHPKITPGVGVDVTLGFGGAGAEYAAKQHDDLTLRHNDGQKARYLIDPMNRHLEGMDDRLAADIRRQVKL